MNHTLHASVETHNWPHSRTLRLSSNQINQVRAWMSDQSCTQYHIHVKRRAYTLTSGEYAVIVYCRDLDVWPQFVLAWL
jgi:hypothetical protein